MLKMLGGKSYQLRILYPVKLSFRSKRKMTFSDKQKSKKFVASRPGLQEVLKKALEQEGKLRNLSLHKVRKEALVKVTLKVFIFLILN